MKQLFEQFSIFSFFWLFADACIFRFSSLDTDYRIWLYFIVVIMTGYSTGKSLEAAKGYWFTKISAIIGVAASIWINFESVKKLSFFS
jgi:hypothetical protein